MNSLAPDIFYIDLDLWRSSIRRIADRKPTALFLNHFGPWVSVDQHLAALRDSLELTSRWRDSLAQDGDDARAYQLAAPFDLCWKGLASCWTRPIP